MSSRSRTSWPSSSARPTSSSRRASTGSAHPRERPFILADDAPALASDAPGTAATRLGANLDDETPLESWLDLLFGESVDPSVRMNRPVPSEPPTPEPTF